MPRRILFTINNPESEDKMRLELLPQHQDFRYMIYQAEIGAEGTPHFQGYLEILKNQRFEYFKKLVGDRAHIEVCRGNSTDNIHYCAKPFVNSDGSVCNCDNCKSAVRIEGPWIYGTPSTEVSGKRYWEEVLKLVDEKKSDLEIIKRFPQAVAHLRTIKEYRKSIYESKNRNPEIEDPEHEFRKIRAIWLEGPSGSGKTHSVYELFPNLYKVSKEHGFDFYAAQQVVMFDDIESKQFKFETLLDYLDVYPCQLNCRYNNVWAAYNDVFILSTKSPIQVYHDINNEDFVQFMRRIRIVHLLWSPVRPDYRLFQYGTQCYESLSLVLDKINYRCFGGTPNGNPISDTNPIKLS